MLGADDNENKPIGKPGQRKAKAEQTGKKTEPRRRKERQPQEATPEQKQVAAEQVSALVSAPVSDEVSASIGEQVIAPISEQISASVSEQSNVAVAATNANGSQSARHLQDLLPEGVVGDTDPDLGNDNRGMTIRKV